MSQSLERLFEVKKESLKLLESQEYNIDEERFLFTATVREFEAYYRRLITSQSTPLLSILKEHRIMKLRPFMSNIYTSTREEKNTVVVYFAVSEEKKVSEEDVSIFCQMIESFGVTNAILISEVPLSAVAESLCTEFVPSRGNKSGKKYGVFIQHFEDNELFFNPLEHVYVPKHRLLSKSEADELMKSEKIRKKQFPQMSALDPIAKRLGARPGDPGDIIEITRTSLVPGTLIQKEIFYREIYMPQKEKKDRSSAKK